MCLLLRNFRQMYIHIHVYVYTVTYMHVEHVLGLVYAHATIISFRLSYKFALRYLP